MMVENPSIKMSPEVCDLTSLKIRIVAEFDILAINSLSLILFVGRPFVLR